MRNPHQKLRPCEWSIIILAVGAVCLVTPTALKRQNQVDYLERAPYKLLQTRTLDRGDREWIEGLIDARKGVDYGDPMPRRYADPQAVYDRLRAIDDRYPPPPRRASTK